MTTEKTHTNEPSPYALTTEDQAFCRANAIDPAAFAMTRAAEVADRQAEAAAALAGSAPAKPLDVPKAVLTEADRKFCEAHFISEEDFLRTRQMELEDQARIQRKINS